MMLSFSLFFALPYNPLCHVNGACFVTAVTGGGGGGGGGARCSEGGQKRAFCIFYGSPLLQPHRQEEEEGRGFLLYFLPACTYRVATKNNVRDKMHNILLLLRTFLF